MGQKIDYAKTLAAQLTSEGNSSDLAYLKANGPRALPSSPTASGWSSDAIKKQLYKQSEILFAWIQKLAEAQLDLGEEIDTYLYNLSVGKDWARVFPTLAAAQAELEAGNIAENSVILVSSGSDLAAYYCSSSGLSQIGQSFATFLARITALESDVVYKAVEQIISGKKTFTGGVQFSNGDVAFGSTGSDNGKKIDIYYTINLRGPVTSSTILPGNTGFTIGNSDNRWNVGYFKDINLSGDVKKGSYTYALPSYSGTFAMMSDVIELENDLIAGSTIVGKASKDANGDIIPETYLKKAQIVNNVTSDSSTDPLSAAQGKYLKGLIDAINTLLASDDTTLDELQEVVSYIKTNRDLITAITTSKVNVSDIIDALNSTATNKPLSANQGKVLKGLIDAIHTTLTPTITETYDLGSSSLKYKDLYLSGKVKDGTREMTLANIMEVSNALGTIDQILDQLNGEVV